MEIKDDMNVSWFIQYSLHNSYDKSLASQTYEFSPKAVKVGLTVCKVVTEHAPSSCTAGPAPITEVILGQLL